VAAKMADSVLSLPMHHGLTDQHFAVVEEALRKVLRAVAR